MHRSLIIVAMVIAQAVARQCGSSGSSPVLNTQSIVVNAGPEGTYFNGAFTTVTVCVPGTSTCQTVADVLVDTGSIGLRVLASAMPLQLPQQKGAGGGNIVECSQFVDGITWGPVQSADVKLAGETAANVPIQVIGAPAFGIVPGDCLTAGVPENTLADLGANGILGIGLFRQDCGGGCTFTGSSNPGMYYLCVSNSCQVTAQPLTQQLQNPIWVFSSDNNGVAVTLPTVPIGGVVSVSGSITFGIGTQSDNGLGSAHVQTTDGDGNFTTIYNGQSYSSSFIDSGTNGLFFLDAATTGLPLCPDTSDFYCPAALTAFTATNRGANGTTTTVTFNVGNFDNLSQNFNAFSEVGGPNPGEFDWGLPFFYGRTVFIGIEGQTSPGGTGPYWAY